MAKKASPASIVNAQSKTSPAKEEVRWGGFIDIRMNEEDKENYTRWMSDNETEFWQLFEDCLGMNLKFGLSWDSDNNCFVATFTAILELSGQYRYTLTARAGTWEKALSLLLFKHYVLLNQNWATFKPSTGRAAEIE